MTTPAPATALLSNGREGTVRTEDGVQIHYLDTGGPGPAVVLVHGLAMSIPWWHRQLTGLRDQFRVVAVDCRSHGESEKVVRGMGLPRLAGDIRVVLDHLDLREVTLVGWSAGANAVLAYWQQFGAHRLARLVHLEMSPYPYYQPVYPIPDPEWTLGNNTLEAQQASVHGWLTDPGGKASAFLDLMFAGYPSEADRPWMLAEIRKALPAAVARLAWDLFHSDLRAVVSTVDIPVLVLSGARSKIYPLDVGEWLNAHFPRPAWHVFADSGHAPFLEQPTEFNGVLGSFVQGRGNVGKP